MARSIPTSASPSNTAISSPIAVVGRQYCISEHPLDLVIVRESTNNFTVTNLENKLLFILEPPSFSFHNRRILRKINGDIFVTLRDKFRSRHKRCEVFSGESDEEKDLLFTAKRDPFQPFQCIKRIKFFLANNTKQRVPDFILEGSKRSGYYNIYAGDRRSNLILAKLCYIKGNFTVTIYPNVDFIFILSITAIFNVVIQEDMTAPCNQLTSRETMHQFHIANHVLRGLFLLLKHNR